MAIEQFENGELLASIRSKLNANDVELDSRLTVVESQLQSVDSYYTKPTDGIPESDLSASVQSKLSAVGGLGTAAAQDTSAFATAAQGAKADTALQVAPVSSVAGRTGSITLTTSDISGLGTAATQNTTAFATAAQGAKADTALQQAVQLTVSSTPVIVALGARGSLPFDVEIVPTDNTVTIRFEVSYNNQSSYTVIGDYTEYTPRRWVKAPTDAAPTHLRFSRIAGTATTSVVFLGL